MTLNKIRYLIDATEKQIIELDKEKPTERCAIQKKEDMILFLRGYATALAQVAQEQSVCEDSQHVKATIAKMTRNCM
jgi:hypothetical protein